MEESALRPLDVAKNSFVSYLKQYWVYAVLGLLAINALFLDILPFFSPKQTTSRFATNNSINLPFVSQNSCPQSCVDQFSSLISSKPAVSPSQTQSSSSVTPTLTPTPTVTPTPVASAKEFFIPLGIGSGNAADWTSIPALGVTLDPSNFSNIKKAYFEITVRVPTGNQTVWVRLGNATTGTTVAGTEMSMDGGTPKLLISTPITFANGSNFYQVQMKTQLQYPAYIDQARIRIQTN